MLELAAIRTRATELKERLMKRSTAFGTTLDEILVLDEKRRATQTEMDNQLAEMNRISKEIGLLMRDGKQAEAEASKGKTQELKDSTGRLKETLAALDEQMNTLLYQVPNAPCADVPAGRSAEDNHIAGYGKVAAKDIETGKPHWDLAAEYDLIDFELGVKVTGAGFPIYKGKGARLQRALINFFLDEAENAGYREHIPPHMVNRDSGFGTGQLPDKDGQMYYVGEDELYLIPTAEVPLTNMFRDVILQENQLPVRVAGYTPCFRREAGSYGKDVRGLNRLHQFDKVEIVEIEHPDRSYQTLDRMVEHVKGLLEKLELPYRVLLLCGGDMGFTSAKTFDMEVYSGAQKRWLEVSSISNFETFQANRLKCRFKNSDGKTQLVHTLNGSALALPRIVAALLENNQEENRIRIPAALVKYTGFEYITK
jgi:seryl-tRNA synthetase